MSDQIIEENSVATSSNDKVVFRRRKVTGGFRGANGMLCATSARPKSEYISPSGISTLDIRTRLRISEAELAIVQREVSDLLVERNTLETSARQYEDSWRFTVQECGRVVEQRDELQRRLDMLEQAISAAHHHTPEKGRRNKVSKAELEQCKVALETQTRVCETLEHERDNAYDNFEFAQAQLHTLMRQYQELASGCSEVARERDKAQAEVQLLKEELHRYDPDLDGPSSHRNSLRRLDRSNSSSAGELVAGGGVEGGGGEGENPAPSSDDPLLLLAQAKELRDEKERFEALYEMAMKRAEQYQKQYYRAEEDRRQALATSEALTALWQKKFEKAQTENHDLRQELLSTQDRISHLHERLAMARLQSRGSTPIRPLETPPTGHAYSFADATPHRTSSFHGSLSQGVGVVGSAQSPLTHLQITSLSQSSTAPNLAGMLGRASSLRTPSELISPSNAASFTPSHLPSRQRPPYHEDTMDTRHQRLLYHHDDLQDSGSHSTDEEGSWI